MRLIVSETTRAHAHTHTREHVLTCLYLGGEHVPWPPPCPFPYPSSSDSAQTLSGLVMLP